MTVSGMKDREAEEVRALLRKLEAAFGDLSIPAENGIVEDNSGRDLESNAIRKKFQGRPWQELSIDDLAGESAALAFFTPKAFRFFLPAFIRVSLTEPERVDLIPDAILWSLVGPDESRYSKLLEKDRVEKARQYGIPEQLVRALVETGDGETAREADDSRRRRLEILTAEQKRVIRNFVSFLKRFRAEEFDVSDLDHVDEALQRNEEPDAS